MIVLDTNVVSEPIKDHSDARVLAWLDRQLVETLYLTSVSVAELLTGVEKLPDGQRKARLAALVERSISFFGERVLPFDAGCAREYARLYGRTRSAARALSLADGQIASIALTHGFIVATRDKAPFIAAGLEVIDPWTEVT